MEMSIREARARFSEAIAAAERGERVVVTRHGTPVVELVPAKPRKGIDFEALDRWQKEAGLDGIRFNIDPEFDDPAYSRRVLGLED